MFRFEQFAGKKYLWFIILGYGLHASNSQLIFSERMGYTKVLVIGGWKFKILTPKDIK